MNPYNFGANTAMALALLAWHPASSAAVYKCEANGKTAYQAEPCQGGQPVTIRAAPSSVPANPATPAKGPDRSAEKPSTGTAKKQCTGEELSLSFQTAPLSMVLQVIADFSGRRAEIDPSVTGNPPIQYVCTPWRTVLQDIAQQQKLDIRIEDKRILVRKRQ